MSEEAQGSAEAQDQVSDQPEVASKSSDTVSYDTHRRLLAEKKKRDEEFRSLKEQLEKLQHGIKEQETLKLKEKEDFRKLYEMAQKELEDTRGELQKTSQTITNAKKYDAFFKKLGTSLPDKYWGHIDLDAIALDDSGRIDDLSLEAAANGFRKEYGDLLDLYSKRTPPKLPQDAPRGIASTTTLGEKSAKELASILGSMLK